ncbi:subtilisin-like protein [Lactarius quietus]|nr:subtilisin-like protein [Lactarius quietus]
MRYCHRLSLLSLLTAAPLGHLAMPSVPPWGNIQLKHMWNDVPLHWKSLGLPPAETTIDLHIALKARRENALIDALYEVSDPSHPKYGEHLSKEQVAELVAPHPETLELVNAWLEHSGVSSSTSMTHGGGWLTVARVPVSKADDLLGASYQIYQHKSTNETILRTVSYALPSELHSHVQTIVPTTHFAPPRMLQQNHKSSMGKAAARVNASLGELVTVLNRADGNAEVRPDFLRALYKTDAYVPAALDRNRIGIADYGDQSPSQEDLTKFMIDNRVDAESAAFSVFQVNGGLYDPENPSVEGAISTQYPEAIAYPTPLMYYSVGGTMDWSPEDNKPIKGDTYLEWLKYVIDQPSIPQTISSAYGEEERALPSEYTKALCFLFAQLGARGVSVLFASGDDGVGKGDCKDDSGNVQFIPNFPASCPYVTSVGGTTGKHPEDAAELSGGGFSFHFPRPPYQKYVMPTFLKKLGNKYAGLYNHEGRGIPDISAQALNFAIVLDLEDEVTSGTSCSAPTAAGIISLLNDFRLANGKTPLGFLNPWLYDLGLAGLNDIKSGSNKGCNTEGFSAIEGWDPVRLARVVLHSFSMLANFRLSRLQV